MTNEEFLAALDRLASSITNVNQNFDDLGNTLTNEQTAAQRRQAAIDAAKQKELAKTQEQINAIEKSISQLITFSGTLISGAGTFGGASAAIGKTGKVVSEVLSHLGIIGKILGATVGVFNTAMQEAISQLEKAYTVFEDVSRSGVVMSFTSLRDQAGQAGLLVKDFGEITKKYSKDLASFGGSAIEGVSKFADLAKGSEELRDNFQKLGMNTMEVTDMQLSYISMQTKLGRTQGKTTNELIESSGNYIRELDLMAKLTGQTTKDLQNQRDEALSETRFRSAINDEQNEGVRIAMQDINSIIKSSSPEIAQGMRDLFGSQGVPLTEAAKKVFLQSGGEAANIIRMVRSGQMSSIDAVKQLSTSIKSVTDPLNKMSGVLGDNNALTADLAGRNLLAAKTADMTQEQWDKLNDEQKKKLLEVSGPDADLAKARQNSYKAGAAMEQVYLNSNLAIGALKTFSEGLLDAAKFLKKHFADKSTEVPVAVPGVYSGADGSVAMSPMDPSFEGAAIMAAQEQGQASREQAEREMKQDAKVLGPTSNTGSVKGLLDFIGKYESNGNYNSVWGGGSTFNLTGMTLAEIKKFQADRQAAGFASTALGKYQIKDDTLVMAMKLAGVKDTDKFDQATQDKLATALLEHRGLSKYKQSKDKNVFADSLAHEWAALPLSNGRSVYDKDGLNKALVSRNDFLNAIPAFRNGGVVQPTPSGSIINVAEAGQAEAIIPLPDGRSIPAIMKNSEEQTMMLKNSFTSMCEKLDSVINLLQTSNRTQTNIARSMA